MSRLRALIVTSAEHGAPDAGDRIVLRHLETFLRARYDCETLPLGRREGWRKAVRAAVYRVPLELAPYWEQAHKSRFRRALAEGAFDRVFILHEGLFFLAGQLPEGGPVCTLFAHNLLSRFSLDSPVQPVLHALARNYERRWYAHPRARLVLISEADKRAAIADGVADAATPVAPPGAPPGVELAHDVVLAEAVVTGRYGWWRKKRDLASFARTGAQLGLIGFDPAVAELIPGARLLPSHQALDWSAGLRAGVITDRFSGGFKLKALEYVSRNCVILSRCRIREDFEGLPHAAEFVLDDVPEEAWPSRLEQMRREDAAALAARFRIFKAATLARFDWTTCLDPLAPDAG